MAIGTICLMMAAGLAAADRPGPTDLPVIDGVAVLAEVNGERITLDEFLREIATLHMSAEQGETKRAGQDPTALLERLIKIRLILQEAVNIGLDELPDVTDPLDSYRAKALTTLLFEHHSRGITADEDEVDRIFKESVREVRYKLILLDSEEEGRKLEAAVEAGGEFDSLAGALVEAGKAQASEEGRYLKLSELLAELRDLLSEMKAGEVSALLPRGDQYWMARLEEVRYPEDAALRQEIRRQSLETEKARLSIEFLEELAARYVVVDEEILHGLDYDGAGSIDGFLVDERPVATIEDEDPITVAELTRALERKAFHGIERSLEQKKINNRKYRVLSDMLRERVTAKEALRLEIERTPEFEATIAEYENGLLFGTFVERVIDPEIEPSDAELEAYTKEHSDELMSPELMRLEALTFADRGDAASALGKLREGADFEWIREHAKGQVAFEDGHESPFTGQLRATGKLFEQAQAAMAGATAGQYRLCADDAGRFHVVLVREVVPPRPLHYTEIPRFLTKRVREEKRQQAIEEWAARLRAASEIEIHASGEGLDRILGLDSGEQPDSTSSPTPSAGE